MRELLSHIERALADLGRLSWRGLLLDRREEAVLIVGLILVATIVALLTRHLRGRAPGRTDIVLPALPNVKRPRTLAPIRHAAFLCFLAGVPFFVFALADPHTTLTEEEASYPGHRITILIDASLSMDTAFSTEQLGSGNTFLANVAAAEYFVRLRKDGPYHDLVSLIEFGNEAYVVTPFTNDYENILLSIQLIGTPEEFDRFPDHGTLIMRAISRGVQMFRTFDFLKASGNLIVIFSDGQDTHAQYEEVSLDEILEEAIESEIPVYFIRTAYNQALGDVQPDRLWKQAVERTGGRFYPAANEAAILRAVHEIDELSTGRIDVTRYITHQPRFAPFALMAVGLWTVALAGTLGVKHLRRFP